VNIKTIPHVAEMVFEDFTLYFLAYDHNAGSMTAEEKSLSKFNREGTSSLAPENVFRSAQPF